MAKRLGDRLIEAGLITRDAVEQALAHQRITGHRIGECLVELGLVPEAALLRFLATELNTRFVSTEKLSKAKVPPELLDNVPVRLAEAQCFLPLAIDREQGVMSIVAAEPQNEAALKEIALVAGIEEVYAFVGLRSAIQAGIRKHYYGDATAFASLGSVAAPSDVAAISSAYEGSRTNPRAMAPVRFETDPRARIPRSGGTQVGAQPTQRDSGTIVRSAVSDNDFAETLNVMVGLLEQSRGEMRGHSSQVGRQAAIVARRLGLPPKEVAFITIASYLHDLGKPTRHLTLLGNSTEAWKNDARRSWRAPLKLFETVRLAPQVIAILSQLFESFDGSGVPQGLKGEDIAIGARIIAAIDAYLDLMKNAANPTGRRAGRDEALELLRANAGTLFDPVVIDAIGRLHSGELLRRRIEQGGRQILIADPDEAVRTDLSDELSKVGIVVHCLNTVEGAIDATLGGEIDLVVVGLRFGLPLVLGLVEAVRADPTRAALPIVVLGAPTDALALSQLQQAGPNAILPLPLEVEPASSTLLALYRDRMATGGPGWPVRGSFDELSQLDLLRTLANGQQSGRLGFRGDGKDGFLQLERGRIVYATFGTATGEAALSALLSLKQADFVFDPDAVLLDVPQLNVDLSGEVTKLERVQAA